MDKYYILNSKGRSVRDIECYRPLQKVYSLEELNRDLIIDKKVREDLTRYGVAWVMSEDWEQRAFLISESFTSVLNYLWKVPGCSRFRPLCNDLDKSTDFMKSRIEFVLWLLGFEVFFNIFQGIFSNSANDQYIKSLHEFNQFSQRCNTVGTLVFCEVNNHISTDWTACEKIISGCFNVRQKLC